jgi:hypothetical protein
MKASVRKKYVRLLKNIDEETQNYTVLKHLLDKGSITSMEAFSEYGITRLSAKVFDLRGLGVDINTRMVTKKKNGKTVSYGVYEVA